LIRGRKMVARECIHMNGWSEHVSLPPTQRPASVWR
jgi:hypothetical protein